MIKTRLKYCIFDPDPNGNPRYYVRKPGQRKIRIPETFEDQSGRITPEFMKAYFEALELLENRRAAPPKLPREQTFYWLVDKYYRSPKFKSFDQLTQADKRSVLDRFCQTAGNLPYASFRKEDVERSQDKRRATPAAADKLVKYLRSLFVWAIKNKLATFGNTMLMADIARRNGIPFDAILGADVAQDYKPKPRVYQASAQAFDLKPSECMMVSAAAHDGDTAGAAKAGLRTATVARPDEFGAGSGPSTPKVAADIIAKDLNDLADKLGA
jgi:FMN phosphatase YigB (HAD superfamily)